MRTLPVRLLIGAQFPGFGIMQMYAPMELRPRTQKHFILSTTKVRSAAMGDGVRRFIFVRGVRSSMLPDNKLSNIKVRVLENNRRA